MLEEVLEAIGATEAGWSTEGGYGDEDNLICPHGHLIEQDGQCHEGCISPLRTAGLI